MNKIVQNNNNYGNDNNSKKMILMGSAHILVKLLSTDLRNPVYPKTFGLDLDLQEGKPRSKRYTTSGVTEGSSEWLSPPS